MSDNMDIIDASDASAIKKLRNEILLKEKDLEKARAKLYSAMVASQMKTFCKVLCDDPAVCEKFSNFSSKDMEIVAVVFSKNLNNIIDAAMPYIEKARAKDEEARQKRKEKRRKKKDDASDVSDDQNEIELSADNE